MQPLEHGEPLGTIYRDDEKIVVWEDDENERWVDANGQEIELSDEEQAMLYGDVYDEEDGTSLQDRITEVGYIVRNDRDRVLYRDPKTGHHYVWEMTDDENATLSEITNLDAQDVRWGEKPPIAVPDLTTIYQLPGEPKHTTEELTVPLTDHEVAEMAMEAARKTHVRKSKEEERSQVMKELKDEADTLQSEIDNLLSTIEKGGERQLVDVEIYYDWENDVKYYVRQDKAKAYKAEYITEKERQSDLFDETQQDEANHAEVEDTAAEMEAEMEADTDELEV